MSEVTLNILIIDEQQERISLLKSYMPNYITARSALYGDAAKAIIAEGDTDLIIMYADDPKGHALYMFGWLKKDTHFARIPVILLTKDEFSERSLDFVELGEASFYEGEIDQFKIFKLMSELLEEAEGRMAREEIQAEQAALDYEKPSGWVSAGKGMAASIVAEEKEKKAAVVAEPKPWQADSAAMVRDILKARAMREAEDADEYTQGINKAVIFAEAVQSAKVKSAPAHTVRIDDAYRRKQLAKSLARGEKKMQEIQKALEMVLHAKMRRKEEMQKNQKKILVVDDDATTLKTIRLFLQDQYDVTLVNSGTQAIDYIIRHKTDLLIIDYRMPMLDGAMTLQSIRYQPNGMRVPALFLTAHADSETVQRCIQSGAQGIIPKPVSQEVLLSAIASLLNIH